MKDKQSRKVVIINDIDSKNIEKAILILRSGGTSISAPAGYHIVTEAQDIINAYSRTVEKTQTGLDRQEHRARRTEKHSSAARRALCVLCALIAFFGIGGFVLNVIQPLLEKF